MKKLQILLAVAIWCHPYLADAQTNSGGATGVTSVGAGPCGTTASPNNPIVGAGNISSADPSVMLTGANVPILSSYCGGTVYLNNASNQIPTIATAGSAGFASGVPFKVCNIGAGRQTLTPSGSTIGGASTYVLAAGTVAAPICVGFQSDGTNYLVNYETGGSGGGAVSSVSNSDSTLTITPTTGAVVASLNLANPNTWTGVQSFADNDLQLNGSGSGSSVLHAPATGGGAVTFFAGSDTVAGLATSQTFSGTNTYSGQWVNSKAGALSTPSVSITGAPVTGGSGTTTVPLLYLNSGTAPSSFSTAGTVLGINMPSGFTGNAIDIHLNGGASAFAVNQIGSLTLAGAVTSAGLLVGATNAVQWNIRGILTSKAAGNVQLGNTDVASPVAQTLSFQSVIAGNTNVAGANAVIQGSLSNGSGVGGEIALAISQSTASSGVQNTAVARFTVGASGGRVPVTTVSALPTCNSTYEGSHYGVSDATAPTFLGTLIGGSTVHTPVYCNGTAWVPG